MHDDYGTERNGPANPMKHKFTCRIQLPKHGELEVDDAGEIDQETFLHRFRTTDWELESKRQKWVGKAWPGIEITNNVNGARLWFFAFLGTWDFLPDFHQLCFVLESDNIPYPPKVESMREGRFQTPYPEDIEYLFKLFFDEDFLPLIGEFARLQPYGD